ncbi:pyridoxamine 5'-phosphate oxidase family protein [Actinoplanes sp. TFC3]|uniref:pyridoxamine 5'-phosphate oxidase family protein n=1 Tax=Actinoplanes sp. TFC3 TaxID=1710355 RepID=UPI00082A3BAA|nr:pyridoxamine 5'-phosphate oxidase family protein [Actinoplanes sp. TFC3]
MANWQKIEQDHPEFAAKVKARFEAGTNKTLATLRRDGSPRISAIELVLTPEGEITFGSMPGARKLQDIHRDPRIAIHSPTVEPPSPAGDAKLTGLAVPFQAPEKDAVADAGYFRVEVKEMSLMYVGEPADHLVIESWDEVHGYRRRTRK